MKVFKFFMGSLLIVLGLFTLGPKAAGSWQLNPIIIPEDIDSYLEQSESQFPDITAGAEKEIIWAKNKGERTDYAVVYVHGFSATRQEVAPVPQKIAERLGANFFATRLTGHGRPGDAMATITLERFLNDGNEAIEIGRRLGKQVVVIGVSTGATILGTLLCMPEFQDIHKAIYISPNFMPKDKAATALLIPWGSLITPVVLGTKIDWTEKAQNSLQKKFWTTQYPSSAYLPMMATVKTFQDADKTQMTVPTYLIYHQDDDVIDPIAVEEAALEMKRAPVSLFKVTEKSGHQNDHVIAGDILSPENNELMINKAVEFILAED